MNEWKGNDKMMINLPENKINNIEIEKYNIKYNWNFRRKQQAERKYIIIILIMIIVLLWAVERLEFAKELTGYKVK